MDVMMNDVMIDLETLGNTPDAAVVQFGACFFNRYTGDIGNRYECRISLNSEIKAGFKTTASTILWWLDQSKESREAVFKNLEMLSVKSENAWQTIRRFLDTADYIWSHATFDFVITQNHFNFYGILYLPFRAARDIRTIYELAEYKPNFDNFVGEKHTAMADAIFQAKCVAECFQLLKKGN